MQVNLLKQTQPTSLMQSPTLSAMQNSSERVVMRTHINKKLTKLTDTVSNSSQAAAQSGQNFIFVGIAG